MIYIEQNEKLLCYKNMKVCSEWVKYFPIICLKFNHKYFTGALCQKTVMSHAPTNILEMPACNFSPEKYKVRVQLF